MAGGEEPEGRGREEVVKNWKIGNESEDRERYRGGVGREVSRKRGTQGNTGDTAAHLPAAGTPVAAGEGGRG